MTMDLLGPVRKSPVKTYLQRHKHKRTDSEQIDLKSDSGSDTRSQLDATAPSMKPPSRQGKNLNRRKPSSSGSSTSIPTTQVARRIDLREVPGPLHKRVRRRSEDGSENGTPITKSKRSGHMRTSSASISSLNQVKVTASSPSLTKPASLRGNEANNVAKSSSKADSASQSASEDDEDASVAPASEEGGIYRTVKDRQEYYKNQPDCYAFGPHRAICSRCRQIVPLVRSKGFAVGPWERHRAKCDQEIASNSPLPPDADELVKTPLLPAFRQTAAERRAALLEDDGVEIVEERRVKCAKCKVWVALRKYDLGHWIRHRNTCLPENPRSLVASAMRKLAIVKDPLVKAFDAAYVECVQCGTRVTGSSGQDYDIAAWEDHKGQCRLLTQTGTSDGANSVPFPQQSSAKPPSTASTEVTFVTAAVNDMRSSPHALKRPRECEVEDERPHNRPRTDTYEPPAYEPPSIMGWFMLPFKSFARGFRESLKNESL